MWARYDRKPTKGAEKRFRKFQSQQQKLGGAGDSKDQEKFAWDLQKDFKVRNEKKMSQVSFIGKLVACFDKFMQGQSLKNF